MPGTRLSTQQDLPSWLGPQGFSWRLVFEVGSVLCTFSLVLPRSVPEQREGDALLAPSPGGLPGLCGALVLCPRAPACEEALAFRAPRRAVSHPGVGLLSVLTLSQ